MAHIEFANVVLEYPVRENQGMTLKDFVLHRLFRKKEKKERLKTVRALSDISFEIRDGERVGLIGLNGAGKSTLLRTIGGIYPMKSGTRVVKGEICSMYDLGVGFEHEATGRQNIYFRSYLQGDTTATVDAKREEIEAFTELKHFLDLPIRCYSTGMLMRLAFAISTACSPEILLIDEVFATADIFFQKKAEDRMRDFLRKARIVVLVGHNLEFLTEFCTRVIWLHNGTIHADGPARQIIHTYIREAAQLHAAA